MEVVKKDALVEDVFGPRTARDAGWLKGVCESLRFQKELSSLRFRHFLKETVAIDVNLKSIADLIDIGDNKYANYFEGTNCKVLVQMLRLLIEANKKEPGCFVEDLDGPGGLWGQAKLWNPVQLDEPYTMCELERTGLRYCIRNCGFGASELEALGAGTLNSDLESLAETIWPSTTYKKVVDEMNTHKETICDIAGFFRRSIYELRLVCNYFRGDKLSRKKLQDSLEDFVMPGIERAGKPERGRYHLRLIFFVASYLLRELVDELRRRREFTAPEFHGELERIMHGLRGLGGKLAIRAHELSREGEGCPDPDLKIWLHVAVFERLNTYLDDIVCRSWSLIEKKADETVVSKTRKTTKPWRAKPRKTTNPWCPKTGTFDDETTADARARSNTRLD